MAALFIILLLCFWIQGALYRAALRAKATVAAGRTGTWWKVTFKSKKTPPLEIEGASEPLVLKSLMAKQIDYHSISMIERI